MTAVAIDHHRTCCHRTYKLSCVQFDRLIERSAGACELCGSAGVSLEIDHEHRLGDMAVRGLVCHRCNVTMAHVDKGTRPMDEATDGYLCRAFFLELPDFLVLLGPGIHPRVAARLPRVEAALRRYVSRHRR